MPNAEHSLRGICELIDQPLAAVDGTSSSNILCGNQLFCDLLGVSCEAIENCSVFDLPDGSWNGSQLKQLLAEEHNFSTGEVQTLLASSRVASTGEKDLQVHVLPFSADGRKVFLLTLCGEPESRDRLAKQANMAKLLYRATALASSSESLQQALEFCTYAVCELTGWPIGHVLVAPERADFPLTSTDIWQYPPFWDIGLLRRESRLAKLKPGVEAAGTAWEQGRLCWIEDIDKQKQGERTESLSQLGITSVIAVPIQVGGATKAVLEFFSTRRAPRAADTVTFCMHLADSVGQVIERKKDAARLREEKETSEHANRSKSQFLGIVSHELRTPLTAILGMLQLATREELAPTVREYLQTAQDSAHSLLGLLNNILDFAGLEGDHLPVLREPFTLRDVLKQATAPLARKAARKDLNWRLEVASDVPDNLVGDPVQLRQILEHLLGNAIKFTYRGEVGLNVELEASGAEPMLRFTISDTGPGISASDRERILEEFTQVDSSFTRPHGGAGLGLALAKALADRMNGTLGLESSEGEGSQFHLRVRFERQAEAGTTAAEQFERSAAADSHKTSEKVDGRLSVLVVEDTPANQKVIRSVLQREGHEVTVAEHGAQALQQVAEADFDAILMDLQMPVMDGYQATTAIRHLEEHRGGHIPIIGLTAHSMASDREACLNVGMDGYLPKPFDIGELVSVLEKHAGRRESKQSNPSSKPEVAKETTSEAAKLDLTEPLRRLGGDEELLREFIEVFHEDSPRLLETLGSAIDERDTKLVARSAHSIKGLAANFDAREVVSLAASLEEAGKKEDLSGAPEQYQEMRHEVASLSEALKQYLGG